MFNKNKVLFTFFLTIVSFVSYSQSGLFKVILDAGHGGHDPGTRHYGHIEKNIALAITLKVGEILEKDSSIKVIYTRKTDVFVTLKDRANIANKANADLFICIHCNSNNNAAITGTEIYVMGMSRANMNFEVSKTENSVIFLEDNYKQTYKGFDPNNPETLLGLKLIQENNLTSSISLASKIQDNFQNNNIESRGVKQEPLWVLDASVMPGVLIETGFVSNPSEANILESEKGQNDRAKAIAEAIVNYKNEYFGSGNSNDNIEKPSQKIIEKVTKDTSSLKLKLIEEPAIKKDAINQDAEGIIYKVQLLATSRKLKLTPNNFNGLKNISMLAENKFYKYMYGETSNLDESKKMLIEAKKAGYSGAFVVAIKEGKSSYVNGVVKQ
ncbi:N-acetylmuramoyl-L-alanine amidase [Flavobacterium sp.]|uniref:N-acetylmuramoyl-L-alanine amidase family protein n=1 Tax=Flavobacterium sp. TaxID=239 RepID=UPI00345CE790